MKILHIALISMGIALFTGCGNSETSLSDVVSRMAQFKGETVTVPVLIEYWGASALNETRGPRPEYDGPISPKKKFSMGGGYAERDWKKNPPKSDREKKRMNKELKEKAEKAKSLKIEMDKYNKAQSAYQEKLKKWEALPKPTPGGTYKLSDLGNPGVSEYFDGADSVVPESVMNAEIPVAADVTILIKAMPGLAKGEIKAINLR